MDSRLLFMLMQALKNERRQGGQDDDEDDDDSVNRYWKGDGDDDDDEWQDDDEEEKKDEEEPGQQQSQEIAKKNIDPTWKTHVHCHDNVRGVSYIKKSFLEENEKNSKSVYDSKASIPKRENPINRKIQPNPLFKSPQGQSNLVAQTFIPNEVTVCLFRLN